MSAMCAVNATSGNQVGIYMCHIPNHMITVFLSSAKVKSCVSSESPQHTPVCCDTHCAHGVEIARCR